MQLKIYDEACDYDIDTICLDDYDLNDDSNTLIEVLQEIIDSYLEDVDE